MKSRQRKPKPSAAQDLRQKARGPYSTILADPPWQFQNRTGKVAPEHRRLLRYPTMNLKEILELPVARFAAAQSHLYLWVPNALLADGLRVMEAWGFTYKTNIVWYKIRKDGGPDGRGVGFYFRNVSELVLFGIRGGCAHFSRAGPKSTSSRRASANIRGSPMRFATSSRLARRSRVSSCSPVFPKRDGINGATKTSKRTC